MGGRISKISMCTCSEEITAHTRCALVVFPAHFASRMMLETGNKAIPMWITPLQLTAEAAARNRQVVLSSFKVTEVFRKRSAGKREAYSQQWYPAKEDTSGNIQPDAMITE